MRVYVATKWARRAEADEAMRLLENAGHDITHDWTNEDSADGMAPEERDAHFTRCAQADLRGLRTADVLLCLHEDAARGMFCEVGMALAYGVPVVVIGATRDDPTRVPIFYWHPLVWMVPDLRCAIAGLDDAVRLRERLADSCRDREVARMHQVVAASQMQMDRFRAAAAHWRAKAEGAQALIAAAEQRAATGAAGLAELAARVQELEVEAAEASPEAGLDVDVLPTLPSGEEVSQ